MKQINKQILNHPILRKLIEVGFTSQSEVRRLIVEEMVEEAKYGKTGTKGYNALKGVYKDNRYLSPEKFMNKYVKGGKTVYPYKFLDQLSTEEQTKYKLAVDEYIKAQRAKASPDPETKSKGEDHEDKVDAAVEDIVAPETASTPEEEAEAEVETTSTSEPATDPDKFDVDPEDYEKLVSAFQAYSDTFYGTDPKRPQRMRIQAQLIKNLRDILLKITAEEAGEAGFTQSVLTEEDAPQTISLKGLKEDFNTIRALGQKALKLVNSWVEVARYQEDGSGAGSVLVPGRKKKVDDIIKRLQDAIVETHKTAAKLVSRLGASRLTEAPLGFKTQEEYAEARREVEETYNIIKDFLANVLVLVNPKNRETNPDTKDVLPRLKDVLGRLDKIKNYFFSISKYGKESKEEYDSPTKALDAYEKAFKAIDIPLFRVTKLEDVIGTDEGGATTLNDALSELRDFSIEIANVFGIKGLEPSEPPVEVPVASEEEASPEDADGDGLPDDEEDLDGDGNVDPGETDPEDTDTDNDGISDFDESPEAKPNSVPALRRALRVGVLGREGQIRSFINEIGLTASEQIDQFPKFLAYYLMYRGALTVAENSRRAAISLLGIPKKDARAFLSKLKRLDKRVYEWFTTSFRSEGNASIYKKLFKALGGNEFFNKIDTSELSWGKVKRSETPPTEASPEPTISPETAPDPAPITSEQKIEALQDFLNEKTELVKTKMFYYKSENTKERYPVKSMSGKGIGQFLKGGEETNNPAEADDFAVFYHDKRAGSSMRAKFGSIESAFSNISDKSMWGTAEKINSIEDVEKLPEGSGDEWQSQAIADYIAENTRDLEYVPTVEGSESEQKYRIDNARVAPMNAGNISLYFVEPGGINSVDTLKYEQVAQFIKKKTGD